MKQKNIIIIGAGIVGVMTARFLQKEGHNITIIDKDIPGNGCSFGNAGYIATDEVWPLARPDTLLGVPKMLLNPMAPLTIRYKDFFHLVPWFLKFTWACRPSQVKIGTKALSNLFNYTDKIWREEFTSLGRTDLFADQGVLKVFENDNIFKKNERERQIQLECGVNLRVLSGHEAREKVPELSNNIKKAIFFKKGLKVTHPFDLTKALVKDFINNGGTLIHDKVTNLETINDKIIGVVTLKQTYKADEYIITSGVNSGNLTSPLGIKTPIIAERGYHIMLPLNDIKPIISSADRGFFLTPMNHGFRLAGTVEFARYGVPETWKRADLLIKHAKVLLPSIDLTETSRWMGNRPTLPDYLPAIGRAPHHRNLTLAYGHQHLGLTLSAGTGKLISDMIGGRPMPFEIEAFDPARFN